MEWGAARGDPRRSKLDLVRRCTILAQLRKQGRPLGLTLTHKVFNTFVRHVKKSFTQYERRSLTTQYVRQHKSNEQLYGKQNVHNKVDGNRLTTFWSKLVTFGKMPCLEWRRRPSLNLTLPLYNNIEHSTTGNAEHL